MDDSQKETVLRWLEREPTPQERDWHEPYFKTVEEDIGIRKGAVDADAAKRLALASRAIALAKRAINRANSPNSSAHSSAQGLFNWGTRDDIQRTLGQELAEIDHRQPPHEIVEGAAHRTCRLLCKVNSRRPEDPEDQWPRIEWPLQTTLPEFINRVFYPVEPFWFTKEPDDSEIAGIQARLTHHLTAVNIKKYTDIEMKPTNWLPHHLAFKSGSNYKVLYVFLDKRWLMDALEMQPFPVPQVVLQEAIMSLDYLFPAGEAETYKYIQENFGGINLHQLGLRSTDRPRMRDFRYYRARLADIAYEFSNPPAKWKLIYKDTRNPMQFWTFWIGMAIAGFTLIFGILSTVLAGLQYGAA